MREHGTRAKYVLERCRCEACRRANCRYARERTRATSAYRIRCVGGGRAWQVERRVPGSARGRIVERMIRSREEAERIAAGLNRELDVGEPLWADGGRIHAARRHLARLAERGIGRNRVAELLHLSRTTLDDILNGGKRRHRRDRPGRRRIHARTCERILGLPLDVEPADGAKVDAGETWRLVGELLAARIPKVRIARAIGQRGQGLQLGRTRVTKRSADAVAAFHREVFGRREVAA